MKRGSVLAVSCAVLASVACHHRADGERARASAGSSASSEATRSAGTIESAALPEDPDAGARSVAQWRQHLDQEERERRLSYDRRKLREHRAVLKTLRSARQSVDAAASEGAVVLAREQLRSRLPTLEKEFDAIDHWGVSSKLLPDYRALIDLLSNAYPDARRSALSGDATRFESVARTVDARFAAIDAWLEQASESEDE